MEEYELLSDKSWNHIIADFYRKKVGIDCEVAFFDRKHIIGELTNSNGGSKITWKPGLLIIESIRDVRNVLMYYRMSHPGFGRPIRISNEIETKKMSPGALGIHIRRKL